MVGHHEAHAAFHEASGGEQADRDGSGQAVPDPENLGPYLVGLEDEAYAAHPP